MERDLDDDCKKLAILAISAVSLAVIAIIALTFSPQGAFSQADNADFINELTVRQNETIAFAETWATEHLGLTDISFDANINMNATRHGGQVISNDAEIWRVDIISSSGESVATIDVDRITGEITIIESAATHTISVNGATITIIDHAGDVSVETAYTAQEVAAIMATEITQQYATNLDGTQFEVMFMLGFWTANVVLDASRTPTDGLPYVIPDFHVMFDEVAGTVNVRQFDW